jgi:hypothetical protein
VSTDHDLVLHVGMPKATSILRPALQQLQPQLRAHGIAYLDGEQLTRLPHAPGWNRDGFTRPKQAAAFGNELADLARTEQQRAGGQSLRRQVPVVVASDDLLGRGELGRRDSAQLRPYATRAVRQVIKALGARKVQVVLHTQRQDRLLELAYLRWLSAGHEESIESYFPALGEPVIDYGDLVHRLRALPRVSDVVVRPVELADAGVHAFVNDTLALLGLGDALDLHVVSADLFAHPPVLSGQGAALARAMHPLVSGAEFSLVQEFLSDRYSAPAEYGLPEILEPEVRARMLATYAEPNRALFKSYMHDLAANSYEDDVATFALGNVLRPPARRDDGVGGRATTAVLLRSSQASGAVRRSARRVAQRLPPAQRQRLRRLLRRS